MKRIITIAAIAATSLAIPAVASADTPDGNFAFKDNAKMHSNTVATYSSQIKQNGQFIAGQDNAYDVDQTTTPGSRADGIQDLLGH
jgi:hypothetical protein